MTTSRLFEIPRSSVILLIAVVLALSAGRSLAGSVLLRIDATNPGKAASKVLVRSVLPQGIGPADILDTAGLAVGYDVPSSVYYVHAEVPLEAEETRHFDVKLRDIWVIPQTELDLLEQHAGSLAGDLKTTGDAAEHRRMADDVIAAVQNVRGAQATNSIERTTVLEHIAVYMKNRDALASAKRTLFGLENAAVAAGRKPQMLLGETENASPAAVAVPMKRSVIRISVTNPSPTNPRDIDIRHALPREIAAVDIVDAAGLLVGWDVQQRQVFVHKEGVAVAPGETKTFDVVVLDKWDVNGPRFQRLDAESSRLLTQLAKSRGFEAVATQLKSVRDRVSILRQTAAPQTVDETYVAFFRNQSDKLQALEREVARIAALPSGPASSGTDTPAPDRRTTWLIIYVILAFLGVLSGAMWLKYARGGKPKTR